MNFQKFHIKTFNFDIVPIFLHYIGANRKITQQPLYFRYHYFLLD